MDEFLQTNPSMTTSMTQPPRRAWLVVAIMFFCLALTFGASVGSGVFVNALLAEFGGSRAHISTIVTVANLTAAATVPFAGWLLDRFDAKWVVAAGIFLCGIGYIIAAQAAAFPALLLGYGFLGLSSALSGIVALTVLVNTWFSKDRAVAFALGVTGIATGALLMANVGRLALVYLGWRWTYGIFGAVTLALVLPLVILIVRTGPEGNTQVGHARRPDPSPDLTVREGISGRSFWIIATLFTLSGLLTGGVAIHTSIFLTDRGYSPAQAATALSAYFASGLLIKPVLGILADRYGVRIVLALGLLTAALALSGLCLSQDVLLITLFAGLAGAGSSSPIVLLPLLQVEVFGGRSLGKLSGLITSIYQVSASLGPIVAGRSFDLYGSYLPFFYVIASVTALLSIAPFACVSLSSASGRRQLEGS